MLAVGVERRQSDLTHQGASEVFDLAEKQPVLIKRRDGEDEILLNAETFDGLARFNRGLFLLTRAVRKGPDLMPDVDGLHWTKLLDLDERRAMLDELIEAARASFERQDASIFNATWKGWEHSAEVLDDPEVLKALLAPIEHAVIVPLERP